jgi:hypothetical protein
MALITALTVFGAAELFSMLPKAEGTAVIAERDSNGNAAGSAVLLPQNLSTEQGRLLAKAYEIAKADGHKDPELVQKILLQETLAGGMKAYRVANPGSDAYFGPMQIKLSATKDVLARFPSLFAKYSIQTRTDDEIKANLILNDSFNIEVASKYLLLLQREYGFKGRELLNAYNRGPGGVKSVGADFHYAIGAEQKLQAVKAGRKI